MTPSAYLHVLATLMRAGKSQISMTLLAPFLLPFTALYNGYNKRDETPSVHFELDWP